MVDKNKTENKSATGAQKKSPTERGKDALVQKNKSRTSNINEVNASEAPREFPMTLDEFCSRLSRDNAQVELIGGFYAHEKHAASNAEGHGMDTQINFKVRFDEFCQQPVAS